MNEARRRAWMLGLLGVLYAAQGIPFGLAAEYLPVELTDAGYTQTQIAALAWLQLPWQLKLLWSSLADAPFARRHSRIILFGLQIALAFAVLLFAPFPFRAHRTWWFTLTVLAATLAATQDLFVDALAVRTLGPSDRGAGNVAQVAGYRVGMLMGGAGLLLCVDRLGQGASLTALAAVIAACAGAAFLLNAVSAAPPLAAAEPAPVAEEYVYIARKSKLRLSPGARLWRVLRAALHGEAADVLWLALTFKLGLHMASSVLKPMVRHAGWSKQEIGFAVVTVGTVAGLLGSALGGALHRFVQEKRAIVVCGVLQGLACVPLIWVDRLGAPKTLTTIAFFVEHLASGAGTTCLFAALMTATRVRSASVHYTLLTSANSVAIGCGGLLGAAVADHFGRSWMFALAAGLSVGSVWFARNWTAAAAASRADPEANL